MTHDQHITASFICDNVSFVYASNSSPIHHCLWDSLCSIDIHGSWLVLGDFNAVMGAHESTSSPKALSCSDFRAGVTICDLVDIDSQGSLYTWQGFWNGKFVCFRLDRAFCNSSLLDSWSQVSCVSLPCVHLDHHPILVSCSFHCNSGPRPFRFQGMWVFHYGFMDRVKKVWLLPQLGSPPMKLASKLKLLKR